MESSLKRVFSATPDPSARPSKLKKITSSILNIFQRPKDASFDTSGSQPSRPNTSIAPNLSLNHDSFRSQSSPITARQLEQYYESIKRENNMLSSRLRDADESLKAESTSLGDETVLNGTARSPVPPAAAKRKVSASASHPPAKQPKKPTTSFSIDPIERAQLIVLKRRMQQDKYRKSRMAYLRDHTRNLVHTSSNTSARSRYVDTSVETIEHAPELATKTTSVQKIPKERLNQHGIFKAVLDYDDDEDEPEVKKVEVKPLTEKIKFAPKKDVQFAPERLATSFDTATKPKFVPEKKPEQPLESAPLKPTPAFTFTDKKQTESPTFSLQPADSKPKSADSKPDVPSFSLSNGSSAPSVSLPSTAGKNEEEEPKRKKFTFGSKPDDSSKPAPAFSFSTDSQKPLFSFSKPEQQPIQKPEEKDHAESKPSSAFSFGAKPADSAEKPALPSFSFGSQTKPAVEEKREAKSQEEAKSAPSAAFSFGTKAQTPAFSFSKPAEESAKPAAPTFSFSSKSEPSKPESAKIEPAKPEEPAKKPETPAFSFGAKPAETTQNKDEPTKPATPSFSFGSKPTEQATQSAETAKPAFNFSSNSFGAQQAEKEEQKPTESKPFSFGATKPAFSFGSQPSQSAAAPASSSFGASTGTAANPASGSVFGSGAPASTPSSSTSGFSFGAASKPAAPAAQPAPAFSFGTSQGFSFGKPANSTNGSLNSAGSGSSAFGQPTASAPAQPGFGLSGSLTNPSAGQSVFGGSTPQPQSKIFNLDGTHFGQAQPQSQTPSSFGGFNPSRSATPNFDFTGASSSANVDPSSVFSAAPSTTPPPNTQTRRKIYPRSMLRGRR
ncbi:hypothetical protein KL918_003169 [Ogataea parapolymorpha]|uniref:Essential component of the nuclear pore complex, which mediates nuclear import and export n=1 Tax=Ogataea parapolymorpha (strain ATCC 26012 / BCRC 20466 / JCM 22074 / NRRL Y-7560 / DL-1) TaxID=871575 RepID=W1QAC5_OGAPD|nr:Essential component of the nuclear pore complex, which mediates nuclear import and export [Ogataea parapolymorpha DL-1]ESW97790.1 Essential component of the nuclear pore complex, which mediates nuclear import and export [Ogataea parapolymorpha DL-1]KAG7866974.1 hypothetical protein KL918_003169 [Ogataea parapolymorpha]KAG7872338.1 hypothetical protein KL916_003073 [Ogataea parapolymorpha]